jgi:release factor glutamine methyltransferase
MLPTPSTSHVSFDKIYEPAEDSYLLLDTLSSETEKAFLTERFNKSSSASHTTNSPSPLVVEIGTGSGVVISFLHAHSQIIFGRPDILTAGVDVNPFACKATRDTVQVAESEQRAQDVQSGFYLGNFLGDLTSPLRSGHVDVLVFNPPYVPTPNLPVIDAEKEFQPKTTFDEDSQLLELSYAGGVNGMETTERLLQMLPDVLSKQRGVGYVLLCAQNKPETVKSQIRSWGEEWKAETVGSSGKKGGWEKLQIVRIWR